MAIELLGREEIEATLLPDSVNPALANLAENLFREDLSYWEEIIALRDAYPKDTSSREIEESLGKGRTWTRNRMKVWELSEEIQGQIQNGELTASDVEIILRHTEEEREAIASRLARAKEEGQSVRERSTRVMSRSRKELKRMMSILFENKAWFHILQYAAGDISDEQLLSNLGR